MPCLKNIEWTLIEKWHLRFPLVFPMYMRVHLHVCVSICVGQRSAVLTGFCLLGFLVWFFDTWSLLVRLNWLEKESQDPPCLCLPSSGIVSSGFLDGWQGLNSSLHACSASTLPTEPSPQIHEFLFLISFQTQTLMWCALTCDRVGARISKKWSQASKAELGVVSGLLLEGVTTLDEAHPPPSILPENGVTGHLNACPLLDSKSNHLNSHILWCFWQTYL